MTLSEKTYSLSGLLKTYCSKSPEAMPFPSEADIANLDWAASQFIFLLLKHAKLPPRPSWEAFVAFEKSFSKENRVSINIQSLLDRHWMRIWGGEIRIAMQIQHQFRYLRDYGKEHPKPEFWKKHKHEFQFLESFEQRYSDDNSNAVIPKSVFLELAERHRSVFPKTPDKDELLNLEWFSEKIVDTITLRFHINYHNRDFVNEIAALVWKNLMEENEERNMLELLTQWKDMVLGNGLYPFGFLFKLPSAVRQSFEEAVIQQLESEQDLLQPESEILKGGLDHYSVDRSFFHPDKIPDFPLIGIEGYNCFKEMKNWQSILDIFYYQPVRSDLRTFIREILILETASHLKPWDENYLKNTGRLLEISRTRPALLYTLCTLIEEEFPEIILVFFKSVWTLSLGCYLLKFVPIRPKVFPQNHRERFLPEQEIRSKLFQTAFEITLSKLSLQNDATFAGKSICEVFTILAEWMYHQKGNEKSGFSIVNEFHQRYLNAWVTFSAPKNRTDFWFLSTPAGFSSFAAGFIEQLESQPQPLVQNNYKYLNLPFLSLLSSLFQVTQVYRRAFPDEGSIQALEQQIRRLFIQQYCNDFKESKVKVLNLRLNGFQSRDVQWALEPGRLDFLGFKPMLEANRAKIGKLLDAVRPQDFEEVSGDEILSDNTMEEEDSLWLLKREDKIRSEKVKFRVHFRFVLRLYRAIADEMVRAKIGLSKWKSSENQIRQKLLDWAGFNRNDFEAGLFDLYDIHLDNHHYSMSSLPPLIHDVIQTVNLFPNEEKRLEFVKHLTNGVTRLDLLLKIHNTVFDDSCKKYIQEVINGIDVQTFTDKQFLWKPIETALIKATNEEAFLQIAENLLAFVKERSNQKKSIFGYNYSQFLLEIQLVLAYRKNDRGAMKLAAEEYKKDARSSSNDYLQKKLQFFEGLFLLFENKLQEAASIWKQLSEIDSSIEVHYRKLYCEIKSALKDDDELRRTKKILNAYEDWENYKLGEGKKEDFEKFWDGVLFCKMAWLHIRGADAEFDYHKSQLTRNALFDIEALSLIFENYARRGMDEQAGHLYTEAKEYFHKSHKKELKSLDALQQLFSWKPFMKTMKKSLGHLGSASVDDVVKMVPDAFNPYDAIPTFLLYEFIFVARELLEKISAVRSIKGENQYNDLFTVLLRMRLSFLRFEIGDQPREGKSPTGKDAGELDMTIRYASKKIAAYEAFFYRSKAKTEEHLTKVFDYNPTGKLFFSVVFFKGKDEAFETKFENYKAFLLKTPFLKRYSLQGGFSDIPGFPKLNNLFFGKTHHGESQALMFHLFINLAFGNG